MNKEQKHHDRIVAWSAIGFLVTLVIGLSVNANAQSSQQSGTACVNGSQYCENNSLDTVNTTTTTNTNTNTNTNQNTNTRPRITPIQITTSTPRLLIQRSIQPLIRMLTTQIIRLRPALIRIKIPILINRPQTLTSKQTTKT